MIYSRARNSATSNPGRELPPVACLLNGGGFTHCPGSPEAFETRSRAIRPRTTKAELGAFSSCQGRAPSLPPEKAAKDFFRGRGSLKFILGVDFKRVAVCRADSPRPRASSTLRIRGTGDRLRAWFSQGGERKRKKCLTRLAFGPPPKL